MNVKPINKAILYGHLMINIPSVVFIIGLPYLIYLLIAGWTSILLKIGVVLITFLLDV